MRSQGKIVLLEGEKKSAVIESHRKSGNAGMQIMHLCVMRFGRVETNYYSCLCKCSIAPKDRFLVIVSGIAGANGSNQNVKRCLCKPTFSALCPSILFMEGVEDQRSSQLEPGSNAGGRVAPAWHRISAIRSSRPMADLATKGLYLGTRRILGRRLANDEHETQLPINMPIVISRALR